MFEQQIAKGVAYLDQDLGQDWPERINLHQLQMNDCLVCVIGQLYGNYYSRFDSVDEGIELGFEPPYHAGFSALTAEWKEKIQQLRKERGYEQAAWAVIREESIDPREQDEDELDGLDEQAQAAWARDQSDEF